MAPSTSRMIIRALPFIPNRGLVDAEPLSCASAPPGCHRKCRENRFPPVAQLDRALPSGGRGQRFESSRAGHIKHKSPPCAGFCVLSGLLEGLIRSSVRHSTASPSSGRPTGARRGRSNGAYQSSRAIHCPGSFPRTALHRRCGSLPASEYILQAWKNSLAGKLPQQPLSGL